MGSSWFFIPWGLGLKGKNKHENAEIKQKSFPAGLLRAFSMPICPVGWDVPTKHTTREPFSPQDTCITETGFSAGDPGLYISDNYF